MRFHKFIVSLLSLAGVAALASAAPSSLAVSLEAELKEGTAEISEASKLPTARGTLSAALAERMEIVRALVRTNPRAVIEHALPDEIRRELLPSELEHVERAVSTVGDFYVYSEIPADGSSGRERTHYRVVINGQSHEAVVYGRRLGQVSKTGIPLQGVMVDELVVLDEDPIQHLEAPPVGVDVIDVEPGILAGRGVFARSGGVVYRFPNRASLESANESLIDEERRIGLVPRKSFRAVIESRKLSVNSTQSDSDGSKTAAAEQGDFDWTTGEVKVLVLRTVCADSVFTDPSNVGGFQSPELGTQAWCEELMARAGKYFSDASYGKTSLVSTVSSKAYRLSKTGAEYASSSGGFEDISDEALALAASDFDASKYDRIVVLFDKLSAISGSQIQFGGMGQVGGKMMWVNGTFSFRTVSHELGHTYGLRHAGNLRVTDGNPVSPHAELDEYGDQFDGMGSNNTDNATAEFGPLSQQLMGWLTDSQVKTVTQNGIYRVHNFGASNAAVAANEVVALKLMKDDSTDVWIALRGDFVQADKWYLPPTNIARSAYVFLDRGEDAPAARTAVLDFTPATDLWDAGLEVGQTFGDRQSGYSIRTVAIGGSGPNRYLDVEVTMPVAPVIAANPTDTTVLAGATATFRMAAVNPLTTAYQWQVSKDAGATWTDVSSSTQGEPTLSIPSVTSADDGHLFRCVLSNSKGSVTSTNALLTVRGPPAIVQQPGNWVSSAGSTARFTVTAKGQGIYQWSVSKNGGASWSKVSDDTVYSGATSATLTVAASLPMTGYLYRCTVSNSLGSITTSTATLTVLLEVNHLANISTRAFVGTEDNVAISGVVVAKRTAVLIRGIGPTLAMFGVSSTLARPGIRLLNEGGTIIATNEGWMSDPTKVDSLRETMGRVGATPLQSSADSALLVTLEPGNYTAHLYGAGNTTGNGMIEVYNATPTNESGGEHFRNLSSRVFVGRGDSIGIAGFVLEQPCRVMIRAVGPSLEAMGVAGVLRRPSLRLHDGQENVIATNTGWRSNAVEAEALSQAGERYGAFAMSSDDDSAMIVDLPAGNYTAHLFGSGDTEGNAIVEVYVAQ